MTRRGMRLGGAMNELLVAACKLIEVGCRVALRGPQASDLIDADTQIEAILHVLHGWRRRMAAQQQHYPAEQSE